MGDNIDFAADIPQSLLGADEALSIYGRWAADRDVRRRCGSAERNYRPGGWEALEARRETPPARMTLPELMVCQRALTRVPDKQRTVLSVLYVPRRMPVDQQFRLLRLPPRLVRERHIEGLRMFDNMRKLIYSRPNDAVSG